MAARNIEIKARLADLAAATETARRLATAHVGVERQVDSYFQCSQGRLKLREINGARAQLVWYARPDTTGPKASDYQLVELADGAPIKAALSGALGVWRVVEKRRDIYRIDNVRVHLDDVVDLGSFLEFEAVLGPPWDNAAGERQLQGLLAEFGVAPEQLLPGSYSDLLPPA